MKNFQQALFLLPLLLILGTSPAAQTFDPAPSGWFFIQSVQAEGEDAGYWDQPGRPQEYKRGANLQVYGIDRGFNEDQQFRCIPAGGGWYYLQPRNGGMVDVARGKSDNGTNILIWDANRTGNQKYRFQHLGDGRYKIHARNGGIFALAGRSHENRSNIHIWEDHEGPFTEWRFINPESRQTYRPPLPPFHGQLIARNVDSQGRTQEVEPGVTEVEVWVYKPREYPDPYKLAEVITTDEQGYFSVDPEVYGEDNSMKFVSRHEDRASAFAIIHPAQGKTRITDFVSRQYESSQYVLTQSPYRGTRYYLLGEDDNFYLANGIVTHREDFFFPEIEERNKWVDLLLSEALPGKRNLAVTNNEEEIVERVAGVFAFIADNARSSTDRKDELAREAAEKLFEDCRARPRSPLHRWPTLTEYGHVFFQYGFIPWGNCTAKVQFTTSLLLAAGVHPDRLFVSKFDYDPGWLVEHWVVGLYLGGMWNSLDPANSSLIKPVSVSEFAEGKWNPPPSDVYDWQHPFEGFMVPGSHLDKVPLMGDDSALRAAFGEKNAPVFFADHPRLEYRSGGMTFRSTGTAEVLQIEGNIATLKITAVTERDGPRGREKVSSERTIEVSFENGVYSYIPDPDYPYTGTVTSSGERLTLSGMQSAMTFSVPQ